MLTMMTGNFCKIVFHVIENQEVKNFYDISRTAPSSPNGLFVRSSGIEKP